MQPHFNAMFVEVAAFMHLCKHLQSVTAIMCDTLYLSEHLYLCGISKHCIHIGHGNMDEEYKMVDAVLGRTTQEKDLGVTFSADMKVSEQCGIAASKGNQILGLIRRIIMYKEKQLIVPLYKAIVRPHLEYCIQAFKHIVKRT